MAETVTLRVNVVVAWETVIDFASGPAVTVKPPVTVCASQPKITLSAVTAPVAGVTNWTRAALELPAAHRSVHVSLLPGVAMTVAVCVIAAVAESNVATVGAAAVTLSVPPASLLMTTVHCSGLATDRRATAVYPASLSMSAASALAITSSAVCVAGTVVGATVSNTVPSTVIAQFSPACTTPES